MELSLRIAHITDLHVSEDGSFVREIDVRKNVLRVLDSVRGFEPGLVVLGGDLAVEAGEVGAYQWIKSELDRHGLPFLITPGNHDRIENLNAVFQPDNPAGDCWNFFRQDRDLCLMGIDSSQGVISDDQLHWLHKTAQSTDSPILLFTHYPPLDCGCRFMDSRYPLANRQDLFRAISDYPNLSFIFCGHYHTEKTLVKQGISIFITPSTMHQISQTNPEYDVESLRPGWRLIEWHSSELSTRIIYPD